MYKTLLWSGLLLAVAFGGPISMFRFSDFYRDFSQGKINVANLSGNPEAGSTSEVPAVGEPSVAGATPAAAPKLSVASTPTLSLDEAFRFNMAPNWVLHRWPRVSADLAQLDLHGYRVPLVTGTEATDVAGSLTYYFNPAQQVQRITFRGTTGDPRGLILLLTNRYQYVRRPNNDPSRLVYEGAHSTGQSAGAVVFHSVPVVRADDPRHRYDIELVMDRPR